MRNSDSMKPGSKEQLPVRVPFAANPAGETPAIDGWAQRAVWTDRMLTTLLNDTVKGGHAFFAELGLYSLSVAHFRFAQSREGPD